MTLLLFNHWLTGLAFIVRAVETVCFMNALQHVLKSLSHCVVILMDPHGVTEMLDHALSNYRVSTEF